MISMNLTPGRSGVLTTIIINTLYMGKKTPKITQRQEIDKDVHKNICIVYKYKDFI